MKLASYNRPTDISTSFLLIIIVSDDETINKEEKIHSKNKKVYLL